MRPKGLRFGLAAAGTAVLAVVVATGAWAQGTFYREVPKDGRIYVFNNMQQFETWEKGGEVGKSITRLGAGPSNETIIFDSEEAINLYNFKHNLPGEVFAKPKEAPKPPDSFSVKVGGTIFTDFTYTAAPSITDAEGNSVKKSEFDVRRAYINVTGNISDLITFRITPDVTSRIATTGTGLPSGAKVSTNLDGSLAVRLKYAFGQFNLDKPISKGSWVRFGQQQTPYVDFIDSIYRYRFQGTSFVDRETFLSSSDVGLSARLALPDDYGDIHLGYYNGDTYSKAEANDQKAFQIRASLRPLPKAKELKGLRLTAFYDHDAPVKDGARTRFVGAVSFEHTYLNVGFEYLSAKDKASGTKPAEVKANGWSLWATPRTKVGLEGLLRFDSLKPNKDVDAKKNRTLIGAAYWFKVPKSGLATALLADYEQVTYDTTLNKPKERRYELKALFNF
jgi:hypothetical protein